MRGLCNFCTCRRNRYPLSSSVARYAGQLLATNRESEIIPNFRNSSLFASRIPETKRIEPLEIEWKRKDATTLKVRLSGRGVYDDHGNFAGHEIIAVDVTEQRTREDQLRHQALSDSLTGLANHRRLPPWEN